MVYVYAKQDELNKYIGENLTVEEIKETLSDIGMDIKGESNENNPELKIEITAEKLDMISASGIGRAIKFYREIETKFPKYKITKGNNKLIVDKSVENIRSKTVAMIVKNTPMNQEFLDEIIKIQEKIHDSFGRNRKKAAIGIYPIDKIKFPINYTTKLKGEISFHALESKGILTATEILNTHETGKKFAHLLEGFDRLPLFIDSNNEILSMPPIINSHLTGRVETNHKNLFVELTGHNLKHLDNILKVLACTFIDMGAEIETVEVIYENEIYELDLKPTEEKIELDFINKLIGIEIKENEIEKYLNRMMYNLISINNGILTVEVPCIKSDVWHKNDIADDVARGFGYNNIIPKFPQISSIGSRLKISEFKERIAETFVKLGMTELYTYMLTSTTEHFDKMNLNKKESKFIKLIDSEDQGLNMIRTQILPDNLTALHINRKNKYPQKIFEVGFTISEDKNSDTKAKNEYHITASIAHPKSNYTEIKSILDTVLNLNGINFKTRECIKPYLIEGRSAEILVNDEVVGFIGELAPEILNNFGLLVPVSSFEINLEKIFEILNK